MTFHGRSSHGTKGRTVLLEGVIVTLDSEALSGQPGSMSSRALLEPKNLPQQLDLSKRPLPPKHHRPRDILAPRALCSHLFAQRAVGLHESPQRTAVHVRGEERR